MLFPLYTHVHVPAGVHHWHAVWADKLDEKTEEPVVELTLPIIEAGFNGVIVRTNDRGRDWEIDLRPGGDHTKIENPETRETFMFLDSMVQGKIMHL